MYYILTSVDGVGMGMGVDWNISMYMYHWLFACAVHACMSNEHPKVVEMYCTCTGAVHDHQA